MVIRYCMAHDNIDYAGSTLPFSGPPPRTFERLCVFHVCVINNDPKLLVLCECIKQRRQARGAAHGGTAFHTDQ